MYNIKVKSLLPDLYKSLDKLVEANALKGRNIYVFGKGIWGFAVTQYLHSKKIDIKGVIDNNVSNPDWGGSVKLSVLSDPDYKVKFQKPEEALGDFDENALVLLSSKHYEAQSKQLMDMGYKKDKNFLVFERAKHIFSETDFNYGERLDLNKIKKLLLDLLLFLKKVCDENGLTYYLIGGTLLGAVRHKGFIPWDDDIDVSMPLKDYMKLHKIFKEKNNSLGKYSLYSMVQNDGCVYAYAKLLNTQSILHLEKYPMDIITHICIDIFPLSGAPMANEEESDRFLSDLKNFNSKWMKYRSYYGMKEFAFPDCKEKWLELLTRYDYETSSGISYIFAEGKNFRVCDRRLYDGIAKVQFEGEEFTTISGYKEYLEIAYGDYMVLPEKWRQFGKHSYIDCWLKTEEQR